MRDEDYREIVFYLRKQFQAAGLSSLADERNYTEDFGEGPRLPDPFVQLKMMLTAFDRQLAIYDIATYDLAMMNIREAASGVENAHAIVLREQVDEIAPVETIDLANLSDLTQLRKRLHRLMSDIAQSRDAPDMEI